MPSSPDVEAFNASGRTDRALRVCDHASAGIPGERGAVDPAVDDLRRHITFDIGAAELTRTLVAELDDPAVPATWSSLVVHCNHVPDDVTAIVAASDGTPVPANAMPNPAAARQSRVERCHRPHHETLAARLDGSQSTGAAPAVIAVHSFTPRLDGRDHPWNVGIEVRQSLIHTPDGVSTWRRRLAVSIRRALERSRRKIP